MRKSLSWVLVGLFVLALPAALVAYNLSRVVFDKALVRSVLTTQIVESDQVPETLEWFSNARAQERVRTGQAETGVREPDVVKALQFLDRDGWSKIKTEILPNEFLTAWLSSIVDGMYSWIDSADAVPHLSIEMKAWKDYASSTHAANTIQILYDALPPCAPEEIADFLSRQKIASPGAEVLYNLGAPCAFPLPWRTGQIADYRHNMDEIIVSTPDKLDLTQELAQIAEQQGIRWESIKQPLQTLRALATLSPLILVALLGLIAVLAVRSVSGAARWMGLPLAVGGVFGLLLPLAYLAIVEPQLAAGATGGVPTQVQRILVRVISVLAADIFQPIYFQAGVIVVLGAALAVAGIVLGRKSVRPASVPASEDVEKTASSEKRTS